MFDLLITSGRIVDGSGNPWFRADVGITGERIAAIGLLEGVEARVSIDVAGAIVCPGFIDVHTHADLALLTEPRHEARVRQGITTDFIGIDGLSYAPASSKTLTQLLLYMAGINGDRPAGKDWSSVNQFLSLFDRNAAVNVAYFVPHCALRIEAMGWQGRRASPRERDRMKELAAQAMADGAVGFSTGLDYAPNSYADTDELIEICRVVGREGGVYHAHTRNLLDWESALQETVQIGVQANIPVHVTHLKAIDPEATGKVEQMLAFIDRSRQEGVDLTFDSYPYTAGSGCLTAVLPSWMFEGGVEPLLALLSSRSVRARLRKNGGMWDGKWESVFLVGKDEADKLEGMSLVKAAQAKSKDPVDFVCDLLLEDKLERSIVNFTDREEDVATILRHPVQMVGSDGILAACRRGQSSPQARLMVN